jgi:ADP-ribose pyrophosphatase YjhB (NUDIX family)
MTLPEAIRLLDEISGDPTSGLPEELFLFISRMTPLVNVDLLIQNNGRTLLTWRSDEHYGSGWHIPGGIIRYKETAHQRLREVARQELGATEIDFGQSPIAVVESIAPERNRGHFISLLYRCQLNSPPDPRLQAITDPPAAGAWCWHTGPPPDLLEVHNMYRRFIEINPSSENSGPMHE